MDTQRFSRFAARFTGPTGTRLLMDDLGEVLAGDGGFCNLGGGNPAQIPAMQQRFREALTTLVADGRFVLISGSYDGPQGNLAFIRALAALMREVYGWPVDEHHVALTAGSQASFFALFNLFAGDCVDGVRRRIQLPLTPEYIGYADIPIDADALASQRPAIEHLDDHLFKYRVDFDHFRLDDSTGAVCVSRPTNPTGNVLSGEEMDRLIETTASAGVPFIVDNAYGVPFPGIVFEQVEPVWAEHIVYCMSLSKLGLPGLRTGIVIANPVIIDALRSLNAITTLASGSLGAVLTTAMLRDRSVLELARTTMQPYYAERVALAQGWCRRYFDGLDFHLHKPEGAIFLWLWFPGLPIPVAELYERLKARRVLVIPGHYFFPGLDAEWQHRHECLRISYAQSPREVEEGIRIIGEEVRRAFENA